MLENYVKIDYWIVFMSKCEQFVNVLDKISEPIL